jgi:2,4-diketo-3-deoxy-L-fuconate hydrolase
MKLVRIGPKGAEKPAVATDSGFADLSSVIADITPETLAGLPQLLKGLDLASLPRIEPGRFGSPIARTGHFIAIGLNYADHAAESGMPIPAEPVVFSKAPSCLSGPDDDVVLPQGAEKGDWESNWLLSSAAKPIMSAAPMRSITSSVTWSATMFQNAPGRSRAPANG